MITANFAFDNNCAKCWFTNITDYYNILRQTQHIDGPINIVAEPQWSSDTLYLPGDSTSKDNNQAVYEDNDHAKAMHKTILELKDWAEQGTPPYLVQQEYNFAAYSANRAILKARFTIKDTAVCIQFTHTGEPEYTTRFRGTTWCRDRLPQISSHSFPQIDEYSLFLPGLSVDEDTKRMRWIRSDQHQAETNLIDCIQSLMAWCRAKDLTPELSVAVHIKHPEEATGDLL